MEQQKNYRKVFNGIVVSDKMNKTRVVSVPWMSKHKIYQKNIRRSTRFKAHDEKNASKVGDRVTIAETRPLSKDKRWIIKDIRQAK